MITKEKIDNQKNIVNDSIGENVTMLVNELIDNETEAGMAISDAMGDDEVYEWWTLTNSYFMQQLEKLGEVVVEANELRLWGRQTTGQSIYMDDVIEELSNIIHE